MSAALRDTDFPSAITDRYFEDYQPGSVHEYGYETITEQEILDFARSFDPQPIHIDLAHAAAGPFDGLIASGLHTMGLLMRIFVGHYLSHAASLASPGVDEVRWPRPVRPGDTLWLRATVLESRRSRSKPDRGVVRTQLELFNQHDDQVMSMIATNFLALRNP